MVAFQRLEISKFLPVLMYDTQWAVDVAVCFFHAESSTSYHLFFLRIELTITLISHAESSTIVGSTGFYVLVSLGGLFLTVVLVILILVVAGLCRQRRLKYYSGGSGQRESDTQPIVMEGFPQNEYPTDNVETKE